MFSFPGDYRSWILDAVEPVCKVGIDVYHLCGGMGWKLVFELAESAENCGVSSLLVYRYSDGFFAASWAGEDCGEFLFDDSNYSASSSPQPLTTHPPRGVGVNIYLWSGSPRESELICCQRSLRRLIVKPLLAFERGLTYFSHRRIRNVKVSRIAINFSWVIET